MHACSLLCVYQCLTQTKVCAIWPLKAICEYFKESPRQNNNTQKERNHHNSKIISAICCQIKQKLQCSSFLQVESSHKCKGNFSDSICFSLLKCHTSF
ncbi:hypothetical protein PHAVU_002G083500 [Phaseolus vulgaris]|uniref:Uncharacterized protein n=1 Tax=Phaseolus vulgaris TaxID=3885 RepID=V7CJX2_PHAVU|nr:hypothetical protein PHAVU_002G083500g [Phaseolus vulgaris]ESW29600.1 hypothetical protein PHAVU_002G083500g [Phaseolus vulgaris]